MIRWPQTLLSRWNCRIRYIFFVVFCLFFCEPKVITHNLCIVQEHQPATWLYRFWQFERFHGLSDKKRKARCHFGLTFTIHFGSRKITWQWVKHLYICYQHIKFQTIGQCVGSLFINKAGLLSPLTLYPITKKE